MRVSVCVCVCVYACVSVCLYVSFCLSSCDFFTYVLIFCEVIMAGKKRGKAIPGEKPIKPSSHCTPSLDCIHLRPAGQVSAYCSWSLQGLISHAAVHCGWLLQQCGSTCNCLCRSIPEINCVCCWHMKQLTNTQTPLVRQAT